MDEPIKLEIFLDDKTRAGVQSAGQNITSLENQMKEIILILKQDLVGLQKSFKEALSGGITNQSDLAEIQALKGAVTELEQQLKDLKKETTSAPKYPKVVDLMPYVDEEVEKLDNAEARIKLIITNIQKDIDVLRTRSVSNTSMGIVNSAEEAKIKSLENTVRGLTEELKKYELAKRDSNEVPLMKHDPAPRMNSVKMSMAQIARELPSIAMGPQMFFLAISNNIPIFTDALASARQEYKRLTEAGQAATPIWKQTLSSLFSFQTLMATGITLLVVYGKEIGDWVASLFKAKEIVDGNTTALNDLTTARRKGSDSAQAELIRLKLLYQGLRDDTVIRKDKLRIVKELQDKYPSYFGNLSQEKLLAGDVAGEYIKLSNAIMQASRARALEDKITENSKKDLELRGKYAMEQAKLLQMPEYTEIYDTTGETGINMTVKSKAYIRQKEVVDNIIKQRKELQEVNSKLASEIKNPTDLLGADDHKKPSSGSTRDYQAELAEARMKTQLKIEKMQVDLMQEGYLKRKSIQENEYKETLANISQEEQKELKLLQEAAKKKGTKVDQQTENKIKSDADSQRALATIKHFQNIISIEKEWRDKSLQSWIDYNKEYGTLSQKRLAITQDYTNKIAKAETKDEKASLKKKLENDLKDLDFSNLQNQMNWEAIFGNLSALTKKQLDEVKRQLIAFKNSPEFKKDASPEKVKVVEDALNNINNTMADKSGFFGGLSDSLKEYKLAVDDVTAAQKELEKALISGDEAAIEKAQENVNSAKNAQYNAQANVTRSNDKAIKNITAVTNAITELGEADISLTSFGNTVGTLVDTLSESGSQIGGIIAALLAVMDQIGQKGLDGFLSNIFESSWHATGGMLDSIGKIFGIKGAGGIFSGADYSGYNEMMDQYKRLNEVWDDLLDKKKEYIETSYGAEAVKASKEAEALINKSIESYRTLGVERLNSGASIGSHSIGVRQRKNMSSSDWEEARKALGSAYDKATEGRMTGLFDLSVEQLEKLKSEAPTFWAKLDDDVRGYLNSIIEGQEKIEEIQKSVKEQLTQVSFDSVRSSFLDVLMDMDSSAEDFADSFSEHLQKAILNDKLAALYDDRLQAWYDSFANANKDGINSTDYANLKEEWNKIVSDALADRDALKEVFGWTGSGSSQSGRSGSYSTLTQEQGTKLEGLFTSVQDHVSSIDNLLKDWKEEASAAMEVLNRIAEHTSYCKYLETINEYMERIDREGVKMKG